MTRQEIYDALIAQGIEFDHRAKKAVLQEIYDKLHVHREVTEPIHYPTPSVTPPIETEEERANREAEEDIESDPELDENGEPIDPELGGEGTESAEPATEPAGELDELMGRIGAASAPDPTIKKERPLFETTRKKKKRGESSPDSFRIEGYVLLLITDTVFPFAFAFVNNWIDKRIKITASELQLSEKDFDKLEPLADQATDYMSVGLNPLVGFALVSTFMYSNNLLLIRAEKESTSIYK